MTLRKTAADRIAIDERVSAEVDDPEAWEEAVWAPPSSVPRPEWANRAGHLELSARFHVLSVLHRLGAEANLTLSHPDDVDITVVRKSGEAVTIDVKTFVGPKPWPPTQFTARKNHFVVLVHYPSSIDDLKAVPAVYVVGSESLKRSLTRRRGHEVSLSALADYVNAWEPLTSEPAA